MPRVGATGPRIPAAKRGRIDARPTKPTRRITPGLHALPADGDRGGLVYVPRHYEAGRKAPFVLALHGSGGDAENGLVPLQPYADELGLVLLAMDSREYTWDLIVGDYGPDVTAIDMALADVFSQVHVDAKRLAIEGFSDGGSYALSLGVTNGDLFTHVIAFSPGFMAPAGQEGMPRIFLSHGERDPVLPIDNCGRRVRPVLERAGYDVDYVEFPDGHTVPPAIAPRAAAWLTG